MERTGNSKRTRSSWRVLGSRLKIRNEPGTPPDFLSRGVFFCCQNRRSHAGHARTIPSGVVAVAGIPSSHFVSDGVGTSELRVASRLYSGEPFVCEIIESTRDSTCQAGDWCLKPGISVTEFSARRANDSVSDSNAIDVTRRVLLLRVSRNMPRL